jgi:hypothetical protein
MMASDPETHAVGLAKLRVGDIFSVETPPKHSSESKRVVHNGKRANEVARYSFTA